MKSQQKHLENLLQDAELTVKQSNEKIKVLKFELKSQVTVVKKYKQEIEDLKKASLSQYQKPHKVISPTKVSLADELDTLESETEKQMVLKVPSLNLDSVFIGAAETRRRASSLIRLTPSNGSCTDREISSEPKALVNSGILIIENLEPGKLILTESALTTDDMSCEKNQRRPATEEYFGLSVLAAKINSPHMETVCSISNKFLYAEAQKRKIPFHRWHAWVDEYLTE